MKVKVKRNIEQVEEIELPKFHTTFFRNQYFDGEKLHSFSHSGEYVWLNAKINDLLNSDERITETDKKTFIGVIDKTIENLKQLKQKVEDDNG